MRVCVYVCVCTSLPIYVCVRVYTYIYCPLAGADAEGCERLGPVSMQVYQSPRGIFVEKVKQLLNAFLERVNVQLFEGNLRLGKAEAPARQPSCESNPKSHGIPIWSPEHHRHDQWQRSTARCAGVADGRGRQTRRRQRQVS